jgi:hypothetical protein
MIASRIGRPAAISAQLVRAAGGKLTITSEMIFYEGLRLLLYHSLDYFVALWRVIKNGIPNLSDETWFPAQGKGHLQRAGHGPQV